MNGSTMAGMRKRPFLGSMFEKKNHFQILKFYWFWYISLIDSKASSTFTPISIIVLFCQRLLNPQVVPIPADSFGPGLPLTLSLFQFPSFLQNPVQVFADLSIILLIVLVL